MKHKQNEKELILYIIFKNMNNIGVCKICGTQVTVAYFEGNETVCEFAGTRDGYQRIRAHICNLPFEGACGDFLK